MSLILLLHLFLSIVQYHTIHTVSPVSPTQFSTIPMILSSPSRPQATCKLRHTFPLLPSSKTTSSISHSPTDHLFYQTPRSTSCSHPLHLPSSVFPIPSYTPPSLPLFIMCYIEASSYIHCTHLNVHFWTSSDLEHGHLRPKSVMHSYHRLPGVL